MFHNSLYSRIMFNQVLIFGMRNISDEQNFLHTKLLENPRIPSANVKPTHRYKLAARRRRLKMREITAKHLFNIAYIG